jgi:hypothetical protein
MLRSRRREGTRLLRAVAAPRVRRDHPPRLADRVRIRRSLLPAVPAAGPRNIRRYGRATLSHGQRRHFPVGRSPFYRRSLIKESGQQENGFAGRS